MKIFIANSSEQKTGGGFSFIDNFTLGMKRYITDYNDADIVLIPSASMVKPEVAEKAKADGKKVVLRIDNAIRDSRNSGHGMSRMARVAKIADLVIYQSQWAKGYLDKFLQYPRSAVILNGVDTKVFNDQNRRDTRDYLYSRFNRDETKGWEVARYYYSQKTGDHHDKKLIIVGQFSPDLTQNNFDFYEDERFQYMGVQTKEVMADIYKQCRYLLYTYFNDACSNTLIEALVSGCLIVGPYFYRQTGGAKEIIAAYEKEGPEYFNIKRMCEHYKDMLELL